MKIRSSSDDGKKICGGQRAPGGALAYVKMIMHDP